MPKEEINYPSSWVHHADSREINQHHGEDLKEGDTLSTDMGISFHWSKGEAGLAQIAVELDVEQLRELIKAYDAGEWVGETNKTERVRVYSAVLNRWELQRLIRTARKVRDDVFDADE
jgi:hypothetical protein